MDKVTMVSIGLFVKEISQDSFSLWMQKRVENGPLNNLWEFPGGKIEDGETPLHAVKREILEETKVKISSGFHYQAYPYTYGDKKVCLHTFLIPDHKNLPFGGEWFQINYLEKSTFLEGKIPKINHQIIDDVANYIRILFLNNRVKMVIDENIIS